eukprot:jgi/Mesvir1/23310/Mv21006-RA.1
MIKDMKERGMLNTSRKDVPITARDHFAKQFVPVPNSGGGDCFYLALAQAGHQDDTGTPLPDSEAREMARRLRRAIVNGIPSDIQQYIVRQERWESGDEGHPAADILQRYQATQSRDGEFAQRPEILAAAAFLKRPIVIHRVTPGTTTEHRETYGGGAKSPIHLVFSGPADGGHFQALRRLRHSPRSASVTMLSDEGAYDDEDGAADYDEDDGNSL